MKRIAYAVLLLTVLSFYGVATASAAPKEPMAVYYDATDIKRFTNDWDQRCLLETLQGIVNRKGPRLFLNSPAWDMPWDNQWVDIYSQRNGIKFRRDIQDITSLLRHFKNDVNGIVVYDPKVDGSRYVAMTLAGVENLLPVSPGLLDGYFGSLGDSWTGVDFAKVDVYQLLSGWGKGCRRAVGKMTLNCRKALGLYANRYCSPTRNRLIAACLNMGRFCWMSRNSR